MIDAEALDRLFGDMIHNWNVASKLGITSANVRRLRYKLKNNLPIKSETKWRLLQRFGYRHDYLKYSDKDLIALIKFYISSSQASRAMGPEYIVEKFKFRIANKSVG